MTADELAASLKLLGFQVTKKGNGDNTLQGQLCLYTFLNEDIIIGYIYETMVTDIGIMIQARRGPMQLQEYYDKLIEDKTRQANNDSR